MAVTLAASLITAAGAGYGAYETAQPGAPRRQQMSVALGAVGYGVGYMIGGPAGAWIGSIIGSGAAHLFFQDEVKKIVIPEEKNAILSPESRVSSNVVIPVGFGSYHCVGNILSFAIERIYYWHNYQGDIPSEDERKYFIATGISANPAELKEASIGKLSFHDSNAVNYETFPNGGRSQYPDQARSDYYLYQSTGYTYHRSWDTDWVSFFSENNSVVYFHFWRGHTGWATAEEIAEHSDVYIHRNIGGDVSVKKLEAADWVIDGFRIYYAEENVIAGDYKITFQFDEWLDAKHDVVLLCLKDNTTLGSGPSFTEGDDVSLTNWVYSCNWLMLKFKDDDFGPENSNFELLYDQGEPNPIAALKSYLTNIEWGLGIPEEKLHTASFDALEAVCDGASPIRTFNGLFTSQSAPQDIIEQLLIVARGLMVFSGGKLKLTEDKFSVPTKSLQEGNTIQNSFQYSQRDASAMVSRFKLDFEDSEHNYAVRSVLFDDITLINKIGIKETSKFLTGVNTEAQATDVGQYVFRLLRQPNVVVLQVSINDADIEPGDMVEVIRPAAQYGDVMRVIDLQEQEKGDIQVSLVSYFPDDEIIVISTEDEFREGTFVDCEIGRTEDGEVVSEGGYPLPEFDLEYSGLPLVIGGGGDYHHELTYTGEPLVVGGGGDHHHELTYTAKVTIEVV